MRAFLKPHAPGLFLALVLLCACEAGLASPALPADVPINPEAGRGGWLIVTAKSESGEDLPLLVDTGTSGTFFDKSFEPNLGKPTGTADYQSWGVVKKVNVYAAPKISLGGATLQMSQSVVTDDLKQWAVATGRPIAGFLGYDCLRHYCVQLDFTAGKMRFLDTAKADKRDWGKAYPIVPLNSNDLRPAVSWNLFGDEGPHSLIDSGISQDGWLMPQYYRQWTNAAVLPARSEARWPNGLVGGEKYPFVSLLRKDVESDGIGLRFLARHLVTLDFPGNTLYLQRRTGGPLPDLAVKTTRLEALDPLILNVLREDRDATRGALSRLEQSRATDFEKTVARKLAAALENAPRPLPADVPAGVSRLALGDARPELAEVGWLKPAANRIPLNEQIDSPLLDSGKIYATGLFAHAPSRYVYRLDGKWQALRGESGLLTTFQPYAFGIIFVIKTDDKEAFRSAAIRGPAQAHYDVNLTGVKTLELLVENAREQNGGNWALWLDPTLVRESPKSDPRSHQ